MDNYRNYAHLNVAWVWDCDECGSENFERSICKEAEKRALSDLMIDPDFDTTEFIGIEDPEEIYVEMAEQTFPPYAKCKFCKKEYPTRLTGPFGT